MVIAQGEVLYGLIYEDLDVLVLELHLSAHCLCLTNWSGLKTTTQILQGRIYTVIRLKLNLNFLITFSLRFKLGLSLRTIDFFLF